MDNPSDTRKVWSRIGAKAGPGETNYLIYQARLGVRATARIKIHGYFHAGIQLADQFNQIGFTER